MAWQRQVFAEMLPQVDIDIGQKRGVVVRTMEQAAGSVTEPPAIEQATPVLGAVRFLWRSPIVRLSAYVAPLLSRELLPRTHPIATLGTDLEVMRVGHAYCAAVLVRLARADRVCSTPM